MTYPCDVHLTDHAFARVDIFQMFCEVNAAPLASGVRFDNKSFSFSRLGVRHRVAVTGIRNLKFPICLQAFILTFGKY